MRVDLVTLVVPDYDAAIAFFVEALGFVLEQDEQVTSSAGAAKRWVVVRPPDGGAGLLLARAEGERQQQAVGQQAGGRVAFFLQVEAFEPAYTRMTAAGVRFLEPPRTEAYGRVAVFLDVAGNRWDLLGPSG